MDKADRLLANDTTIFGLRRMVVARKGEPPNVTDYLNSAHGQTQAQVYAWCVEREVKEEPWWFLWIVWKETT